jgi:hypothetical protein
VFYSPSFHLPVLTRFLRTLNRKEGRKEGKKERNKQINTPMESVRTASFQNWKITVHLTLNKSELNECDIVERAYSGEKCIHGHNPLCGLLK